jgi:hypothetical protein
VTSLCLAVKGYLPKFLRSVAAIDLPNWRRNRDDGVYGITGAWENNELQA